MKYLVALILLVGVSTFATPFAITQHAFGYFATTTTITTNITCHSGKGYIIVVRGTGSAASPSIVTSVDTPTLAINYYSTLDTESTVAWYVLSSAGGANTITATVSGMADLSISFIEVQGINSFDGVSAGSVNGTLVSTTNTTISTDALFSFWINESAGVIKQSYYNYLGSGGVNIQGVIATPGNGQSAGDVIWSGNSGGLASGIYTNYLQCNTGGRNSLVTLAFTMTPSSGVTAYVGQFGAGLTNGADAADCYPESWINDPVYWPGPGSVIHLIGTFTNALTIQGNGSLANPVKFLFEAGANFTSGAWPTAQDANSYTVGGAINPNYSQYIVINGQNQGIIQNTNSGTGLGLFTSSPNLVPLTAGIIGVGSNWVVQNLFITNIYLRTSYTDYQANATCLQIAGSDLMVSNCAISDAPNLVELFPPSSATGLFQNFFLISNRLINASHHVSMALLENCQISNTVIAGNFYDHADVYDGRVYASSLNGADGSPRFHMDYNYILDDQVHHYTNGYFTRFLYYNNVWGSNYMANDLGKVTNYNYSLNPGLGVYTNNNAPNATADVVQHGQTTPINIYLGSTADEMQNVFAFNNMWYNRTNNGISWANGAGFVGSNLWMFNNGSYAVDGTAQIVGKQYIASGINVHAFNNLCQYGVGVIVGSLIGTEANPQTIVASLISAANCTQYELDVTNSLNNASNIWSDFNVFPGNMAGQGSGILMGTTITWAPSVSVSFSSLANLQTWNGNTCANTLAGFMSQHFDPHSIVGQPVYVGNTYQPTSTDTVARGKGTNLYFLAAAYNIPAIANDINGVARASSGAWDVGPIAAASGGIVAPTFTQVPNGVIAITNSTEIFLWNSTGDSSTTYYQLQYTPSGSVILPWTTATSWSTNSPVVVSNQFVVVATNDATTYITSSPASFFSFTNGLPFSFPVIGLLPIQNQK